MQKLDGLYEVLMRWNTECQVLPALVECLREQGRLAEQGESPQPE